MTSTRQQVHDVGFEIGASETIEDAWWMLSGRSIAFALVLGAAAGVIAAAFVILVRAEGLVPGL